MKLYDYFIITLCNTDLECQEIQLFNQEEAEHAASRLRSFLPERLIHSVILEGVEEIDIGNLADEDGYRETKEVRTELKY